MADLVVIVPSRGRPVAAAELAQSFAETCTTGARLVLALDVTDPDLAAYHDALGTVPAAPGHTTYVVTVQNEPGSMVGALNEAAAAAAEGDWFAIGFAGDDHRPRTTGWDAAYLEALRELGTGLVYGNDLLQGENLPTQCAMTSDIVRTLGWMAPPDLTHMYVDNWWLELGRRADCIRYLPDVVVEHMHPVAGKADWDEGHRRVNAPEMYERDHASFQQLMVREMPHAVMAVRGLRSGR